MILLYDVYNAILMKIVSSKMNVLKSRERELINGNTTTPTNTDLIYD